MSKENITKNDFNNTYLKSFIKEIIEKNPSKILSYEDGIYLLNKYIKQAGLLDTSTTKRGFMGMWGWYLKNKKEFDTELKGSGIIVLDKVIQPLHDYRLTKKGFKRLRELESLIR
jgi:hypothetical protein